MSPDPPSLLVVGTLPPEGASPTNSRRSARLYGADDDEVTGRLSRYPTATLAGVGAGVAGLVTFLAVHHWWIAPIWGVALVGLPLAVGGGVIVGRAYGLVADRLPRGLVVRWLVVAAGSVGLLVPTFVVVTATPPYVPAVDGVPRFDSVDVPLVAVRFVVDLLVVSALTGALVGWLLLRSRRGVRAFVLAALVVAIGPGHNVPFFNLLAYPRESRIGTALFLVTVVGASLGLVVAERLLEWGREKSV